MTLVDFFFDDSRSRVTSPEVEREIDISGLRDPSNGFLYNWLSRGNALSFTSRFADFSVLFCDLELNLYHCVKYLHFNL